MGKARHTVLIDAPINDVHNFGKDPSKWQEWFINFHGPDKVTGGGGVGTMVEGKFSIMGKKFPSTVEVLEDRVEFWRAKTTGPLEGEIKVFLEEKDKGTEATLEWTYTLKKGKIGKFADSLVIERMVEHGLKNSIDNWKVICESASHLVSH